MAGLHARTASVCVGPPFSASPAARPGVVVQNDVPPVADVISLSELLRTLGLG